MTKNKIGIPKEYRKNKNILIKGFGAIYFFIPKNGCTSFKRALLPYVEREKYEGTIHQFDFPFAPYHQLSTDYNTYFKFAFVRNPWNRIVSCYKGKIRSSNFNSKNYKKGVARIFLKYGDLFYGDMPFDKFVDAVCFIPDSEANPHFMSQLYRLTDDSGELLPNYIGHLENITPSIDEIYNKTGLSLYNVGHDNKSRISKSYREFYDASLKEKIAKKFAGDIDLFGYEFESDAYMKPIGFVDDDFRERLATSTYVDQIVSEKKREKEFVRAAL